jgi:lipid-A-disaccharide synthase-like uncharacterized protein
VSNAVSGRRRALVAMIVLALLLLLGSAAVGSAAGARPDAKDAGLPWGWLVFGFAGQAAFAGRMLVQWIASERANASVVPRAFWILSLVGGTTLLIYFVRRGDPVGITGQLLGVFIYVRNLALIARAGRRDASAAEETLTPPSERRAG